MKTAIIVDSTAGLSQVTAQHSDIYQLYLSSIFEDGTVFVDRADDTLTQQFYERMKIEKELPKTSQPEPQQVYDLFDQLIEAGYDTVIGVFLSSKISGTFQTVAAVSKEYEDRLAVHLIDSQLTSFVLEAMTLNIIELVDRETAPEEIVSQIKTLIGQSAFYFSPAKLDNLVKGGRVSSLGGMLGNLLGIKPLITMGNETDGEITVPEKVRSMKKSLNRLYEIAVEHIEQYPERAYIVVGHTGVPQDAAALCERILATYPEVMVRIGFITPVLGTHGGSGAVSINVAPLLSAEVYSSKTAPHLI